ncbi:Ig-like domain-containing protein [Sinimarinibacterium sp. NLF-5-8]|uniref:Ig-like domain-containing protein n=1 Tax=Sinimarinibacterium sp. NLF-5-8 TaxID=2698684 RepID=UPI00137BC5A7|nr:Ig-like domain-containing protein [Sinimarinibacterium sp. NLF-5-8]QHS09197.1 hypothetical protein GT972_02835 [Sinimarinibacterium sp. NLF-5-8]
MLNSHSWLRATVFALTCALSACGGAEFGEGGIGDGGGLGGGGSATGPAAKLELVSQTPSVIADGQSSALIEATLSDAQGNGVRGQEIQFSTNAGTLQAASATTDRNGKAFVRLNAPQIAARATVTARQPQTALSAQVSLAFAADAAARLVLSVAPQTVGPGGRSSIRIMAQDINNNPVPEEIVVLRLVSNASGATLAVDEGAASASEIRLTTDENGSGQALYTAGANIGTDVLEARVAAGTGALVQSTAITVSQSAARLGGLSLSTGSDSLPANGSAATAVRATVTDQNNAPAVGVDVLFSASAGSLSSFSARTDAQGIAQVTLTAPRQIGRAVVRAETAGFSDVGQVEFVQADASGIELFIDQTTIGPGQTAALRAVVTDANGNRVVDEPVTFINSVSTAGRISPATVRTDENGEAVATYTAQDLADGVSRVSDGVRAQTAAQSSLQTVINVSRAAVRVQSVEVTLGANSVTVNQTIIARATVTNTNGQPASGITVGFASTLGTIGASATTNAQGIAEVNFTAPAQAGNGRISATAAGFSASQDINVFAAGASRITLSAQPATVEPGQSSTVQVELRDGNGNAVANTQVQLSVGGNSAGSRGRLADAVVTTSASGVATTQYTAGDTGGIDSILASAPGGVTASTSIVVRKVVAPTDQIELQVDASNLVANGNSVSARATVRNANGEPVAGVSVAFSAPQGSFNPTTVTTNSAGVALTAYTPPGNAGNVTLRAVVTVGGTPLSQEQVVTIQPAEATASGITVLASAPTLRSNARSSGDGVTITAQVRQDGNLVVPNVPVSFNASSGLLELIDGGITDASGVARATLTTNGDPTNRIIKVTASNGSINGAVDVAVTGTTVTVDGPRAIQSGVANIYVVTLSDASGAAIGGRSVSLVASAGALTPETATTNNQGKASFTLTVPANQTTAKLTATALGASDEIDVTVSDDSLVFIPGVAPVPDSGCATPQAITGLGELKLNQAQPIRVLWCRAGVPVAGRPVRFTTTRGVITATANTDASGIAAVTLTAAQAGAVRVLVSGEDNSVNPVSSPFAEIEGAFIATVPAFVDLQADPTIIGINQESLVQATVRDANNNLVTNATVNFILTDVSGGSLSAGSAVTNRQGRATITYRSSTNTSAQDGVLITAKVTGVPDSNVRLTVGSQSLRIVLGTGNEIVEDTTSTYKLPYSAIVTDAAGNPAPSAELSLSGFAERYAKGYYIWVDPVWVPVITAICDNEDVNENGILDPGEDTNGNGVLDVANPVSLPLRPSLNTDGVALFDLIYPQDRGNWIETFRLTARARVAGTEATEIARFTLPISAEDASNEDASPPGQPSPFGVLGRCDLTDNQVARVAFSPSSRTFSADEGDTLTLTVELNRPPTHGPINVPIGFLGSGIQGAFTSPASITFNVGETIKTFDIMIADDGVPGTPAKAFQVELGTPSTLNALLGPQSTSQITIRGD